MESEFNLEAYLTAGVENIVSGIIKAVLHNPAESLFMSQYALHSARAASLRKKSEKDGLHIPPFLIASITTQCNLRCAGCYDRANRDRCSHGGSDPSRKPLDASRWSEIFNQAAELGVGFILLAGGEPFLRRDVLEAAGSQTKLLFPVFTNGTLIDKACLDLLERRRSLIPIISVEGGRETTDARRGEGVYETLNRAMRELDGRGLLFGASVTVTKSNIQEVMNGEFIGKLSETGCKAIIYVEYVPADNRSGRLAPDDETRVQMEKLLQNARAAYPDMLLISFPGDEKAASGCLAAGRGFFHINAYGGAEPCPFSPYSDISLADVSVAGALRSPLFTKLCESGGLMADHAGGCALFAHDADVQKIVNGK